MISGFYPYLIFGLRKLNGCFLRSKRTSRYINYRNKASFIDKNCSGKLFDRTPIENKFNNGVLMQKNIVNRLRIAFGN